MNTPNKKELEPAQTPIFEPFPKPQTMPSGWDMSGFESTQSQPAITEFDAPTEG